MIEQAPSDRKSGPKFIYDHDGVRICSVCAVNADSLFSKLSKHHPLKWRLHYEDEIFFLQRILIFNFFSLQFVIEYWIFPFS